MLHLFAYLDPNTTSTAGKGLGVLGIVLIIAGVLLVLAVLFFGARMLRASARQREGRECPACATLVKRGQTACPACGHDFAQAVASA